MTLAEALSDHTQRGDLFQPLEAAMAFSDLEILGGSSG
jgi:hypothetical protein